MKKKLENVLIELGITPNLKGFRYIQSAVMAIQENETLKVMEVYSAVGSEFGVCIQNVERSIRTAISKADINSDAWMKYLGIKNVSNATVLFTLATKLKGE